MKPASGDTTIHTASADPQIVQMATGHLVSQAIFVIAELGIADHLKAGPQTAAALAEKTGTDASSLHRLLRTLTGLGLFTQGTDGAFATTPLGDSLRSDAPGCARSMVRMIAGPTMSRACGELLHAVRTGTSAFDKAIGQPVFGYLAQHADEAAVFNEAMIGFHGSEPGAVAAGYDFSTVGTLVDVGGGTGNLLMTILGAYPSVRGVLYDLPHVVAHAREAVERRGLTGRCQLLEGSFFDTIPSGGDAYLMSHIIHDWDEPKALAILGNCRRAMAADARLLLVEMVIPPGDEMHPAKLLDVTMLMATGGRERTADEYRELYRKAGLELVRIVPTASAVSVIEGRPA